MAYDDQLLHWVVFLLPARKPLLLYHELPQHIAEAWNRCPNAGTRRLVVWSNHLGTKCAAGGGHRTPGCEGLSDTRHQAPGACFVHVWVLMCCAAVAWLAAVHIAI